MSLTKIGWGKVRDIYDLDDKNLLLVSSDRISAFDVIMDEPIGDRGRVLTALSYFWLSEVLGDMAHHMVSVEVPAVAADIEDIEGRCMTVRKAKMLPIEVIVRGYLAGSGWAEYKNKGTLHGAKLPEGLQLGSQLPEPVLTPSTKGELGQHDINLTWDEAADLVGYDTLKEVEMMALEAYGRAATYAESKGFIVADTKFELGYIDGTLSLCDEILTPDSSRFWPTHGWSLGETPPSYDKQQLRDWLEEQPWDKTAPAPALSPEIMSSVRAKYVEIYERLTGRSLADWPGVS